jgi:hypothetical protein
MTAFGTAAPRQGLVDLATLPAGDFAFVVVIGSASDMSSKARAYRRGLILPDVSQRGLDLNQSAPVSLLARNRLTGGQSLLTVGQSTFLTLGQ